MVAVEVTVGGGVTTDDVKCELLAAEEEEEEFPPPTWWNGGGVDDCNTIELRITLEFLLLPWAEEDEEPPLLLLLLTRCCTCEEDAEAGAGTMTVGGAVSKESTTMLAKELLRSASIGTFPSRLGPPLPVQMLSKLEVILGSVNWVVLVLWLTKYILPVAVWRISQPGGSGPRSPSFI